MNSRMDSVTQNNEEEPRIKARMTRIHADDLSLVPFVPFVANLFARNPESGPPRRARRAQRFQDRNHKIFVRREKNLIRSYGPLAGRPAEGLGGHGIELQGSRRSERQRATLFGASSHVD